MSGKHYLLRRANSNDGGGGNGSHLVSSQISNVDLEPINVDVPAEDNNKKMVHQPAAAVVNNVIVSNNTGPSPPPDAANRQTKFVKIAKASLNTFNNHFATQDAQDYHDSIGSTFLAFSSSHNQNGNINQGSTTA